MIEYHQFSDRQKLAVALGGKVACDLRQGIASRGRAVLAVSGGSTPKLFFEQLGADPDVDWSRVSITLVDERWVDPASPRSNEALVRTHLMLGPAAAARFVPLYSGGETPTREKLVLTKNRLNPLLATRFDTVVLGMGNDGHTASYFPGARNLDKALASREPVVDIEAAGAGEPRITLTLPTLINARHLYLHIQGAEKKATLERAQSGTDISEMPIRAILQQNRLSINLFWCP